MEIGVITMFTFQMKSFRHRNGEYVPNEQFIFTFKNEDNKQTGRNLHISQSNQKDNQSENKVLPDVPSG